MEVQIIVESQATTLENVHQLLEARWSQGDAERVLALRTTQTRTRGLDPTVLIAIVGTGGTVLGALITALVQVAQQTSSKKIVLQSKSGRRLEVPADISPDELDNLIAKVRRLDDDIERISVA